MDTVVRHCHNCKNQWIESPDTCKQLDGSILKHEVYELVLYSSKYKDFVFACSVACATVVMEEYSKQRRMTPEGWEKFKTDITQGMKPIDFIGKGLKPEDFVGQE